MLSRIIKILILVIGILINNNIFAADYKKLDLALIKEISQTDQKTNIEFLFLKNGAIFPSNICPIKVYWQQTAQDNCYLFTLIVPSTNYKYEINTANKYWQINYFDWWWLKRISQGKDIYLQIFSYQKTAKGIVYTGESPRLKFKISQFPLKGVLVFRILEPKTDQAFQELIEIGNVKQSLYYRQLSSKYNKILYEIKDNLCMGCHYGAPTGKYFAARTRIVINKDKKISEFRILQLLSANKTKELAKLKDDIYFTHISKHGDKVLYDALEREEIRKDKEKVLYSNFIFNDSAKSLKSSFIVAGGDIYVLDMQSKKVIPLPGASNPEKIEIFGRWSPDDKTIAFVRKDNLNLDGLFKKYGKPQKALLKGKYNEILKYIGKSNIFTISYNRGRGGEAKPLKGAAFNGKSNHFPSYSPDGHWLAFCQTDGLDYIDETSDLYLVPAQGGVARYLECNSKTRDSWPAWSLDGKWLAFISNRDYPKLAKIYISYIANDGQAAPAFILPGSEKDNLLYNQPYFMRKSW